MDMLVSLIGIMRMSWGTECENWQHLTRKKHARVGRKKGDGWCTRSYVRLLGGQCGEVVRALELQDSFDPILHTYHQSLLLQWNSYRCVLSDRRMPSRLEGQPERHEAHENPHRSADIYRHHRETCIRPNQRSNKRPESQICRSLAST